MSLPRKKRQSLATNWMWGLRENRGGGKTPGFCLEDWVEGGANDQEGILEKEQIWGGRCLISDTRV